MRNVKVLSKSVVAYHWLNEIQHDPELAASAILGYGGLSYTWHIKRSVENKSSLEKTVRFVEGISKNNSNR